MSVAEPFANTDPPLDASVALLDLPAPDTKRWVVRRKAIVVAAVRNGSLSLQEACGRYKLSVEEFLAWQRAIESAEQQSLVTEERTVTSQAGPHRSKKLVIDKWHSDFQAVRHAHHVDVA